MTGHVKRSALLYHERGDHAQGKMWFPCRGIMHEAQGDVIAGREIQLEPAGHTGSENTHASRICKWWWTSWLLQEVEDILYTFSWSKLQEVHLVWLGTLVRHVQQDWPWFEAAWQHKAKVFEGHLPLGGRLTHLTEIGRAEDLKELDHALCEVRHVIFSGDNAEGDILS